MPPILEPSGSLQCATCGENRPLSEFDQRFVNKVCKHTCAQCRGITNEITKWQQAWTRRKAWATELNTRRVAEPTPPSREHNKSSQPQVIYDMVKRRNDQMRWENTLLASGYSQQDIAAIYNIHLKIQKAAKPWSEIKRIYHSLTPPCTAELRRVRISRATRVLVYTAQEGRCFYCGRELLALDVWKRGHHGGQSAIDKMDWNQRRNFGDSGIPELDHKIPVSRGGTDEQANLCYACRKCNQCKGHRTAQEFARFPFDPVTEMNMQPERVRAGLKYESLGYSGFDAPLPFPVWTSGG